MTEDRLQKTDDSRQRTDDRLQKTDDRVLNAEFGMRNAERKKRQSFEFGMWNSFNLGFRILDFGLKRHGEGNRRYLQWLIEVIRFTG